MGGSLGEWVVQSGPQWGTVWQSGARVGQRDNKRRLSTVPTETVTCIVIVTGAGGSRGSNGGFPSRGRAIFAFCFSLKHTRPAYA